MKRIFVPVSLIVILLAGCSGLHYYDLNLEPEPAKTRIARIILVEECNSNEIYWTQQMVFRREPFKVESSLYRQWAERPSELIRNAVILFYRNSDFFTRVIDRNSEVEPDISLKTNIYSIEMVKDNDGWYASLALDLEFYDPRAEQVILVHTFDRKERIRSRKPEYFAEKVSLILKEELLKAAEKTAALFRTE